MPLLPHALLSPAIPLPLPSLSLPKKPILSCPHQIPPLRISSHPTSSSPHLPRCSLVSVSTEAPPKAGKNTRAKPSPAEVSRTIMELSSTGTFSSLSTHGWPLAIGARFVVDTRGSPAVCLNQPERIFTIDGLSSFHVQVADTRMVWVDRLGFDLFIYSEEAVFAARIPFPREVTDEKGAKSSFNSMSHLAWEIEKGYAIPDFEKVKCLKRIR
ncbi:hypothetical protein BHM03_00050231 [Ensete ventricosum]|nr:hypothetical protein BHM03_00050231 [Ensete ventricosum]